jgi:uncharacterized protein with FMN-binding domain
VNRRAYLGVAALWLGAAAPTPAATADTARPRAQAASDGTALASRARERSSYRDGRYRATGWYGSLPSSIGVSLTLRSNRIRRVKVTPHATDPTSRELQERFARAVGPRVVGKRIDEVRLTRLAGSSGTTLGFNDALRRIRAKARIRR